MEGDRPLALVTGASGGVGAGIARSLGPTHDVLLGGRERSSLDMLAEELPSARAWPVDVTDVAQLRATAGEIDQLDVLVHGAGIWEPGLIAETEPDTWRRIFDVNVFAVAELTRQLLPAIRAARGNIVLINSTAGKRVSPRRGAYAASKFALRAFADALRSEEEVHGVRVMSVYLGRVDTEMQRRVRRDENGPYVPDQYLRPELVGQAVLGAVLAPADSTLTDITLLPSQAAAQAVAR